MLTTLLFAAPAFSPALTADNQTYKVEGIVTNAVTGRPIPRALVEWNGQSGLVSVLTGPDGEFSFDGVPQGRSQLSAEKPGYFTGRGGAFQRPTVFIAGPESGKVSIKLWPEAIISGRVLGKDGEPLENATIQIQKSGSRPVATYLRQNSVTTDEDGNFRIAELPAGEYLVALLAGNVSRRMLGSRSVQGTEAYPAIVYYPAGGEESNAEPLKLSAGQHVELNFSVLPRPAYKVAGVVSKSADWKQINPPMFVDRRGQPLLSVNEYDPQTGAFAFRSVPAGAYTMRLSGMDQSDAQFSVQQRIRVNKDITGLNLYLPAPLEVPVNVRKEFFNRTTSTGNCSYGSRDGTVHTSDCSDMPLLQLELTPVDSLNPPVHSNWQPPAGSSLILRGLQPGKYHVHAMPGMGGYSSYVSSLRCGFTDLLHEELTVPETGQLPPIEVVLRDDLSILQLRLNAGKTSYGNITIIVDENPPSIPVRSMNLMGDQATTASLAPGNYKIFAFADTEDVDPIDPEELSRYAKKAISATLLPGKTTSLVVELIHTGE
ncbi:MAG TPA: carboxypeptidase-like regulatory domain-containing protein [Candidatus Angelobacter sp.]|nr:carboxypeptidase-like regulatory domain-containing protein [Candidatus Angelobacter sp.]